MNGVTELHQQHAATKQRLTTARDQAASQLLAHEKASKQKAARLAEYEEIFIENATSEALGAQPLRELPDATTLEQLRADMTVAEPVRLHLSARLRACEDALKLASLAHKDAMSVHIRDSAVKPALLDLQQAFDGVLEAAVNLIAAHRLAYHDFSDRRPPYQNANDIYGPIAQWLGSIHAMQWPDYPYDIRPDWLPRNGKFWADELPGVAERMQQLRDDVEQVPVFSAPTQGA